MSKITDYLKKSTAPICKDADHPVNNDEDSMQRSVPV